MSKRALVSVSDKTGIVDFVSKLIDNGYEIISTGGTKKAIADAGLAVMGISEVTGFPEILDGRVKTLHPAVHGGLLSVRDLESHRQQVKENGIEYIDIVAVNLYPFKETVAKPNVTFDEAIENIDIGGPSMLRSAAKNNKFVTVVCDSADYDMVISEIAQNGDTTLETRRKLAAKVFRHTASYDAAIAKYLTKEVAEETPESLTVSYDLVSKLRYGENPHQTAKFYKSENQAFSLASGKQIQGKELSYNNIQDANAAVQISREFERPVVVGLKHMNPCGVGVGADINEAWDKAYNADPVSIFGGIVSTNRVVDEAVATKMKAIFLEVIIAPDYTDGALAVFAKKKNLRIIKMDMSGTAKAEKQLVSVSGGLLVQDMDSEIAVDYKVVTKTTPTDAEMQEMIFAYKVVKHVKSNAIALTKDGMTVSVGAGQMNRVGAAKIALEWAKDHGHTQGIVLASDAFFPFDDVVKLAATYGVKAIIQPGGSIRDEDSIKACDALGISMVFTGMRHFKH
jgi:phosphoribosylaminoimidazolecarboxamide formyltransferase / IMP cyclohydrolase